MKQKRDAHQVVIEKLLKILDNVPACFNLKTEKISAHSNAQIAEQNQIYLLINVYSLLLINSIIPLNQIPPLINALTPHLEGKILKDYFPKFKHKPTLQILIEDLRARLVGHEITDQIKTKSTNSKPRNQSGVSGVL